MIQEESPEKKGYCSLEERWGRDLVLALLARGGIESEEISDGGP